LIASTHASPLLGTLLGTGVDVGNGVVGGAQPIVNDVTGLLGGCRAPGVLTKLTSLLAIPADINPITFLQLVLLLVRLNAVLTRITCTLDSLLPLNGNGQLLQQAGGLVNDVASGVDTEVEDIIGQLNKLLNVPTNGDLLTVLRQLISVVEKILDQLLGNVGNLLDDVADDVGDIASGLGLGSLGQLVEGLLSQLAALLQIPAGVDPLGFLDQLVPQLERVFDQLNSLLGPISSGLPIEL